MNNTLFDLILQARSRNPNATNEQIVAMVDPNYLFDGLFVLTCLEAITDAQKDPNPKSQESLYLKCFNKAKPYFY